MVENRNTEEYLRRKVERLEQRVSECDKEMQTLRLSNKTELRKLQERIDHCDRKMEKMQSVRYTSFTFVFEILFQLWLHSAMLILCVCMLIAHSDQGVFQPCNHQTWCRLELMCTARFFITNQISFKSQRPIQPVPTSTTHENHPEWGRGVRGHGSFLS